MRTLNLFPLFLVAFHGTFSLAVPETLHLLNCDGEYPHSEMAYFPPSNSHHIGRPHEQNRCTTPYISSTLLYPAPSYPYTHYTVPEPQNSPFVNWESMLSPVECEFPTGTRASTYITSSGPHFSSVGYAYLGYTRFECFMGDNRVLFDQCRSMYYCFVELGEEGVQVDGREFRREVDMMGNCNQQ